MTQRIKIILYKLTLNSMENKLFILKLIKPLINYFLKLNMLIINIFLLNNKIKILIKPNTTKNIFKQWICILEIKSL